MSKTTKLETVELVSEPTVIKKTDIAETKAVSPTKKIGVNRYLQEHPQNYYIDALMKQLYPMEFHTLAEWDEMVKKLLAKK